MRYLCIYIYVPKHITRHVPDVENERLTLPASEVKNYINTVQLLAQTNRFVS